MTTEPKLKPVPDIAPADVSSILDNLKPGDVLPAPVLEAIKRIKSPPSNALQLIDFSNNEYRMSVDSNIDLRLLHRNVAYWSSLTNRGLQRFDRIMCVSNDETAMAYYLVIEATGKLVECQLLSFHKIERRAISVDEFPWLKPEHRIVHKPASGLERSGYIVVLPGGGQITNSGTTFPTIELLQRAYLDHAINRSDSQTTYYPN